MATDKQIAANRRNSEKSTGPRTEEGKQRSSLNGVKHGIFLSEVHIVEDTEKLEDLLARHDAYFDHYQPANMVEADLVQEIAVMKIRLLQSYRAETGCINDARDRAFADCTYIDRAGLTYHTFDTRNNGPGKEKETADKHLGYAWAAKIRELELMNRYQSRLRSQYLKTIEKLEKMQAARKAAEAKAEAEAEAEAANGPQPDPPPTPAPAKPSTPRKSEPIFVQPPVLPTPAPQPDPGSDRNEVQ